jgi:Domain of unknown function (DUF397)
MEALNRTIWRKSSYSGTNGGGCVEAGVPGIGLILVRDTTNRDGSVLSITVEAWQSFASSLK